MMNLLKRELGDEVDVISEHGNINSSERDLIDKYPLYKIIGFVRNPWARMLSWYSLINKWNDLTIEESREEYQKFLKFKLAAKPNDPHFHYNQLDYFPNLDSKRITFFSFDNFEEETKKLFALLNLNGVIIPHTNQTESKNYQDYYTPESKELISQICQRDIDYFKFSY
jgi:hypothetical protein